MWTMWSPLSVATLLLAIAAANSAYEPYQYTVLGHRQEQRINDQLTLNTQRPTIQAPPPPPPYVDGASGTGPPQPPSYVDGAPTGPPQPPPYVDATATGPPQPPPYVDGAPTGPPQPTPYVDATPTGQTQPPSYVDATPTGWPQPPPYVDGDPIGPPQPPPYVDGAPTGPPQPSQYVDGAPTGPPQPPPYVDGAPTGPPQPPPYVDTAPTGPPQPPPVNEVKNSLKSTGVPTTVYRLPRAQCKAPRGQFPDTSHDSNFNEHVKNYYDFFWNAACADQQQPGGNGYDLGAPGAKCPTLFGTYRSTRNCGLFYMCVGYLPFEMNCPAGLNFHKGLKVCDYPNRVECNGVPSNAQDGLGSGRANTMFRLNQSGSSRYPNGLHCGAGTSYDVYSNQCVSFLRA